MLPANRIQVRIVGNEAMPVWLGTEDHLWLRALLDDFARLDGRPYREVESFLQKPPRVFSPAGKRHMAIWTLLDMCTRQRPPLDAGKLRAAITEEAQRARDQGRFVRSEVIASSAQRLGLSVAAIDGNYFQIFRESDASIFPKKFLIRIRLRYVRTWRLHKVCSGWHPRSRSISMAAPVRLSGRYT